jgi:hypothetical protein
MRILRQLRENDSLISFGLQADLLRSEYVTVSVWSNEEAIRSFVLSTPHSIGLRKFSKWKRGEGKFIRYSSPEPRVDWASVQIKLETTQAD